MQEISRRTVLVGAVTATAALSLPPSAAEAKPKPVAAAALDPTTCAMLGSTQACVTARSAMDVTSLQYTLTNSGEAAASYTISYLDVDGGPEGNPRTVSVGPGETVIGYFSGELQHCFTLQICPESGGDCVVLGPVCAEYTSGWMMY
ncbi:hypothetical protein [Streptomyces sporangiiformans]|nr:hypothetical protein [Streptomyces sporangiiformans]